MKSTEGAEQTEHDGIILNSRRATAHPNSQGSRVSWAVTAAEANILHTYLIQVFTVELNIFLSFN